MALLDRGDASGGSTEDEDMGSSPYRSTDSGSGPDTGRDEPDVTITDTDTNKDSTSIDLGSSRPGGAQRFDGTAGAEQPDTPSKEGETVIVGGSNEERQEARDEVFSNESDRQKALAEEAEKKKETVKEVAKTTEGWLTGKSVLLGALASLTVIIGVLKGVLD